MEEPMEEDIERTKSDEDQQEGEEETAVDMDRTFSVSEVNQMESDELVSSIKLVKRQIEALEADLGEGANDKEDEEEEEYELETFAVPEHCIPIRGDVRTVNFADLSKELQFDVILMDPPWQLAGAAPTRGVAIGYKQLPNKDILDIPVPKLQKNGFLFIWVINARYAFALEMFEKWGYELCDDIAWVKTTVNRRMAKGHGFYLQHAKETCLVGKKGKDPIGMNGNVASDVIFAERRGQSQKPEQIYEMIEQLVPNGKYLEIFARRNNLRNYWVSVGLEL
eukprot:TRINITY_DN10166_c0_g1_i1.p1 TRINITY_DN10166_c0_g1~~TRINITY_DN10166_c0_g1_i1.p1  ORF type:complete len:305 (+),score=60.89 TRINITY_DN10166_c0_g1_i1:77-916(+)